MLGQAREYFEPTKRTLGQYLRVPPWFITLSGLVLAILAAFTYHRGAPLAAALVGTAAALCDFLDGAVARHQQRQSLWGNYLEALVDRLVEIILLLTLAPDLGLIVAWAIAASMFVSYCKPRVALVVSIDNHDWPGIGDHADRMVLILVSMALCGLSLRAGQAGIVLLTLTTTLGSLQRIHYAYRLINAAPRNTNGQTPPSP